ncbi:MAG: oligosaccharide flippase family protein [Coriobacteriia bacterium]|nr:oligosaccharide flippase family protein [Coriobacteriia bacterium]
MSSVVAGALAVVLGTRILGQHDFGLLSAVTAAGMIAAVVVDFGMDRVLVIRIAREIPGWERCVGEVVWTRLLLLSLSVLAATAVGFMLLGTSAAPAFALGGLSFGLRCVTQTFEAGAVALGRARASMVPVTAYSALYATGLVFLFVRGASSVYQVLGVQLLAAAVSIFVALAQTLRLPFVFGMPDWRASRSLLRESLPFAVVAALAVVYSRFDMLFLAGILGAAQVSVYGAVYRAYDVALMVRSAATGALIPRAAKRLRAGSVGVGRLFSSATAVAAIFGCAVALGGWALSGSVVRWVFPAQYVSGGTILGILAWGAIPLAIHGANVTALYSGELDAVLMRRSFVTTVAALVLVVTLVPLLGAVGAALSTVAAEAVSAVVFARVVGQHLESRAAVSVAAGSTTAAMLGACVAARFPLPSFGSLSAILVAASALLVLLGSFGLLALRGRAESDVWILGYRWLGGHAEALAGGFAEVGVTVRVAYVADLRPRSLGGRIMGRLQRRGPLAAPVVLADMAVRNVRLVAEALVSPTPRLVVVMGGNRVMPALVNALRRLGSFVVVWTGDDPSRHEYRRLQRVGREADLTAVSVEGWREALPDRSGRGAIVIPFAGAMSAAAEELGSGLRTWDIVFVGAPYGFRIEILTRLARRFRVGIWGRAWQDTTLAGLADLHPETETADAYEAYGSGSVVLNLQHPQMRSAYNPQFFEIAASGSAQVVLIDQGVRPPDPDGMCDGVTHSTATCDTIYDVVESLLSDPGMIARMGAAARQAVAAHHTWPLRAMGLLEVVAA